MALKPEKKPFIVPVFIPHAGCPHRCVFCDQTRTTGDREPFPTAEKIESAISQFLSYQKQDDRWTEISYFGGNFLGLPAGQIKAYLELANGHILAGRANAIRFSTRPDTIDPDRLALLKGFAVSTIELGVQSMNDTVLTLSRRGHSARDTRTAVSLLKKEGNQIGLQMMVGLPGDSAAINQESGEQIAQLQPDFVRIYPCLVLEGSPLAQLYANGRFEPLTLEAAVDQVKTLYRCFAKANIPVIRMGLQPTDQLNAHTGIIAGPFHPAFGELVHSALWLEALQTKLDFIQLGAQPLEIRMHPSLASRINGHKRHNIRQLKSQFQLTAIHTISDPSLPENSATLNGHPLTI